MANRYDATCQRLEADGWRFSHSALYNGYRFSGAMSTMQTRGGLQYIRVHVGRCHNVHGISCQETLVYFREVSA